MQARGDTEANNPELRAYQQQNFASVSTVGSGSSSINGGEGADAGKTPPSTLPTSIDTQSSQNPPIPPTPLSGDQLMSLKYQILAFKLISRNLPVPPLLQQAMFNPNQVQGISSQDLVGSIPGKIVEASNVQHNQQAAPPTSTSSADIGTSTQYNSYTNPHTYLKPIQSFSHASRQQRILIPSISPPGIDPQDIAAERERYINVRRQQRIYELESFLNNKGDNYNPNLIIKAKIEFKALKALELQQKVRKVLLFITFFISELQY